MVVKPYYQEKINSNTIIRTFDCNVKNEELVWHRDKGYRKVEVIDGEGWEIQFENCLPAKIEKGDTFYIPSFVYHRIKRGNTNLKLSIEE